MAASPDDVSHETDDTALKIREQLNYRLLKVVFDD